MGPRSIRIDLRSTNGPMLTEFTTTAFRLGHSQTVSNIK